MKSIKIPHKFIDRLTPGDNIEYIKFLIIGTFNPGYPILNGDTLTENDQKNIIKNQAGLNFYDRANNRFWGVLDRLYFKNNYLEKTKKYKRINGLKLYKGFNSPNDVFQSQQNFCKENGVFITDIVSEITVPKIEGIYNGFNDQYFDNAVSEWNTKNILSLIDKYNPHRVLFTFSKSKTIPEISKNVQFIIDKNPTKTFFLSSPSGNAKKSYEQLIFDWSKFFFE